MASGGLTAVRARIAAAAQRAGRDESAVTLVAVSKAVGAQEVMAAYDNGQRDFGENRANELQTKAAELPGDIRWHFVGTVQSRKAKDIAPLASVVHSVDRASLLQAWGRTGSTARLLLQVNLAAEPQKHGASRVEAPQLLRQAADLGMTISGLMVIPPVAAAPEDSRRWFIELRRMRDDLSVDWPQLSELSMGMTDDFEVAIEEGATLIRVGRAIFGR